MGDYFKVFYGTWEDAFHVNGRIIEVLEEAEGYPAYLIEENKTRKHWIVPLENVLFLEESSPAEKKQPEVVGAKIISIDSKLKQE